MTSLPEPCKDKFTTREEARELGNYEVGFIDSVNVRNEPKKETDFLREEHIMI